MMIMKKSTLSLIALFCMLSASLMAQTQKGSVMIGGTAGFSSSKTGDYTETDINLSPMAGFFIMDQLAIGGGVNFGVSSLKFDGETSSVTSVGVQPMVRYYFNGSGKARFFGQANFQYASVKFEEEDAQSGIGFGAGVGIDFFLNDHVAIEGLLGYNSFKVKDADDATGTFGLQIGVAAFIGGGSDDK